MLFLKVCVLNVYHSRAEKVKLPEQQQISQYKFNAFEDVYVPFQEIFLS